MGEIVSASGCAELTAAVSGTTKIVLARDALTDNILAAVEAALHATTHLAVLTTATASSSAHLTMMTAAAPTQLSVTNRLFLFGGETVVHVHLEGKLGIGDV